MPKVFIIVLNWNGLKDTLECLDSVFKLEYPNFEVIVVDNASTDNSVEVIREKFQQVILIENKENLGFTGGNNTGIRHALQLGTDYFWLLNNDTVLEPDTLSRIVVTADNDSTIGMISPVVHYHEDPLVIQNCGCYIDWESQKLINTASPAESEIWQTQMPDRIWLWIYRQRYSIGHHSLNSESLGAPRTIFTTWPEMNIISG